ncbi:citrate/2-methylcitrate synthase [Georgenia yuyongxinii]|uniref:citrate synthase (unknown stereospecificity) n=1 Tax=Georgenia yuyongxinii TaxID=2589797 RepID=A0A552WMD8_9MICO|nr:citrate/2-methylcitrate synthase [Georgenia yuyongxinii]TRW43941.1 citrate synthase [Georgenia yuyongxinii]
MSTTPAARTPGDGTDGAAIFALAPATGTPVYRGRPVAGLLGTPFERLWGLLVDGSDSSGLPPAEPFNLPVRTGNVRVDVQSALAQLTPVWAYRPLVDIAASQAREDLARASVMTLSFVAQSARGEDVPAVPQREVDLAGTITERFLVRWRGEADPAAVAALDTFWLTLAENGLSPSTRTARLAAEQGADVAACLSAAVAVASGPLGGGGSARALALMEHAERTGDPAAVVAEHLARDGRLPGFGDPHLPDDARGELLRAACLRVGAARLDVAEAVAQAGGAALARAADGDAAGYRPGALFWGAVLLDHVGVPADLLAALYVCGRTAGWSAHVLEVQRALRG